MIRLTITPAAYTAILATHPASTGLKQSRAQRRLLRSSRNMSTSSAPRGSSVRPSAKSSCGLRRRAKEPEVRLADHPSIARRLVANKLQANHTPSRDAMVYGARLAVRANSTLSVVLSTAVAERKHGYARQLMTRSRAAIARFKYANAGENPAEPAEARTALERCHAEVKRFLAAKKRRSPRN